MFEQSASDLSANEPRRLSVIRQWWVIGLLALLTLGVMGATLKYSEDSARRQQANATAAADQPTGGLSFSTLNSFVPNPTPTPQLSKEYIYAGSRLLAVEDKNANAAPPADLAIWRVANGIGTWWVLNAQGTYSMSFAWGAAGDRTVPGDYDGDGKTDFSVYRPTTGYWYISNSSNGTTTALNFGASDDITANADYDGDGRTDMAVYRPNTGYWYIVNSSTGSIISYLWGAGAHTPVSADYDGDGRADIAVWYNAGAVFQILKSSDNYSTSSAQTIAFGQTDDKPVAGDYDGDGKADLALRRGNVWHIKQSSNGATQEITWQQSTDKEVQNDYDGDGKVDIAVWRESLGWWFIRQSSKEGQPPSVQLREAQWGQTGDTPVPAFYRR